ncbi:uncharacterized protein LOC143348527 [Colletes latitarsis]|uniref:uncharacterized protein LOC143348527 n=1 Tax=Colletes latitarsis TaxID=2605962 RepID=UPI0040358B1F
MILGNVKKRLEEDYDEYFSVNEFDLETDPPSWDTKIRESRERPMGIDVTDDCVVCASNLDLNRSHSSYYSSLREHDCTPSSSIEYCSATNVSLTRLRSEIESLSVQRSSLIDASFDDNEDFQDSREFLDKGLASPATNVSNSKLITESLDSGILTDYSRHLLRAPQDRSQKKSQSSNQVRRYAREWDLLPTYDFDTDSSYSDESLDRRVDVAVKKFTENLILAERRARVKLRLLENPASHRQGRKRRKRVPQVKKVSECILKCSPACRFESPHWWTDDDRILSSSTPPLFSFSDSEIDHV